jgi:hypothetical protein
VNAPQSTEPVINHDEAWSLACYKREHSNMARCYIETVDLLRRAHSILSIREAALKTAKGQALLGDIARVLARPGESPPDVGYDANGSPVVTHVPAGTPAAGASSRGETTGVTSGGCYHCGEDH